MLYNGNETKRKNYLKLLAGLFLAVLTSAIFMFPVFAAPVIKEADYQGRGLVEVEFKTKVNYSKPDFKVTVKDTAGKAYAAKVVLKDNDEVEFRIVGYAEGKTYNFTIAGIKKSAEKSYGKVSGKIRIPKAAEKPAVKKAEYDAEDKKVEFEFSSRVQYKGLKVTIKYGSKNYVKKILEKGTDDLDVKVAALKKGRKYKYTIKGIRRKGGSAYYTVSGTFTA